jgi:pimeloyl-ACP methyl ester carboxylesterase
MLGSQHLSKGPMMLNAPETILFLPGASGNLGVWTRVAARLQHPALRRFVGWPGFGSTPPAPDVHGFDDLVSLVVRELIGPTAIFAQSMGGTIALRATLRLPNQVTHLILSATSGGIDLAALGARDWRPEFRRDNPHLPTWFEEARVDLAEQLSTVTAKTLLLWGTKDPISPVAVGERLATLLPRATLHLLEGGEHDLVDTHAEEVASVIERHLAS